jgi:hypothetical protein
VPQAGGTVTWVLAVDDTGVVHRVSYDEDDRAVSACGLWAGRMAAATIDILTCPECLAVPGR